MARGKVTVRPKPVKVIPGTALAEEIAYNAAVRAKKEREERLRERD